MARSSVQESLVIAGLNASLPVAAEATTSRTAVSNDAVRAVAFVMDEGQELTDHASTASVVVLVTEGRLRFTVGSQPHDLVPGDVVYLAPGERHAVLALTPCRFTLVMSFPAT